ncbi:MAG: four helix bundle protein [Myxococcales bacterium]|nr:four helix bundle protein [Myxococcales bacterium]
MEDGADRSGTARSGTARSGAARFDGICSPVCCRPARLAPTLDPQSRTSEAGPLHRLFVRRPSWSAGDEFVDRLPERKDVADEIAGDLPRGRAYLADQLRRAATSIPLNIAEGAVEFAAAEKARFHRIARRSATECAALFDVCRTLRLASNHRLVNGRGLLLRIDAMLTAMVLRLLNQRPGSGSGSAAQEPNQVWLRPSPPRCGLCPRNGSAFCGPPRGHA